MLKISVVVPTFNRCRLLEKCIASLANLDYPTDKYEVIVVDNDSSDSTAEVVQQCIKQYAYLSLKYICEKKPGLVHARHAGLKHAQFEILSFTDDDAFFSHNWLSAVSAVFIENPQVSAVAGKIVIHWDKPPPAWVVRYETQLGKLDYGPEVQVAQSLFINGGSFHIRKGVLFAVGGFNPDQIGDWIIGDGETGLCRKLHKHNHLIGWAPASVMYHCQFVNKNAKIKDIARRYINNGRSIPYSLFAIEHRSYPMLIANCSKAFMGALYFAMKAIWAYGNKDLEKALHNYFRSRYFLCQIPYTIKIIVNPQFRALLHQKDWLEK